MPNDEPPLSHLPYDDPRRTAARHREMVRLRTEALAQYQDDPAV